MPETVFAGPGERRILLDLQTRALTYFLDNQSPHNGLFLDRQANFSHQRPGGQYSLATTGMGLIALALASGEPYALLTRRQAVLRCRLALRCCLERLPHTAGILPHFVGVRTGKAEGFDTRSTVDSGWALAGALWAASYLRDAELADLAGQLFDRVDWKYWTGTCGLLSHGSGEAGETLPCCWDRLNGETVFLYVLAAGADRERAWCPAGWDRLGAFEGEAGGWRFASADLGLFVFQYGLDLLDVDSWTLPGPLALADAAWIAPRANARVCQELAGHYRTYRSFWGLSAGDGPGTGLEGETYRAYSPEGPIDGTACLTAAAASLAQAPALVWENLSQALARPGLLGRYGLANVNLDRGWVGRDMVGIDAGALVLALDNVLAAGRVRRVFHGLLPVQQGVLRLGARPAAATRVAG